MPHAIRRMFRGGLGFTMVELLVAVAVVGVLVWMLIPVVAAARGASGLASCQTNQMTINVALAGYESDYQTYVPPDAIVNYVDQLNGFYARFNPNYYNNPPGYGFVTYQMFLWPYASNRRTWIDPGHAGFPDAAWDGGNSGTGIPNYDPIGSVDGQFWWMNYGANPNVMPWDGYNGVAPVWKHASDQLAPSNTMAVMDSGSYIDAYYDPLFDAGMYYTPGAGTYAPYVDWIDPLYDAGGPWGPGNSRTVWVSLWAYDPNPATDPWTPRDANLGRHPGKQVNVLYCDGHVQATNASLAQQAAEMVSGYVPVNPTVEEFYTGQQH